MSGSVAAANAANIPAKLNNIAPGGPLSITKSGYLYIWVSNETQGWDVFFDNLAVQHQQGPLLEENHYYPFGLAMAGLNDMAIKTSYAENKFRYNEGTELQNKEFSDGTGWEMYETSMRSYDPQIGRFGQIDPMAMSTDFMNPYQYASNNPISFNDPTGLRQRPARPETNLPSDYSPSPLDQYGQSINMMQQWNSGYYGYTPGEGPNGQSNLPNFGAANSLIYGIVGALIDNGGTYTSNENGSGVLVDNGGPGGKIVYNYYDPVRGYAFFADHDHGNVTTDQGVYYLFSGTSFKKNVKDVSDEEVENRSFINGGKITEALDLAYETTEQGVIGAQKLANTLSGTTKDVLKAGKYGKISSVTLGAVNMVFTVSDAESNGWKNHHYADLAITGGEIILSLFETTNPIGWALGAAMFITNVAVEHYTGKTVTEYIFDK